MATATKAARAKDEATKYVQFDLPESDHRRLKAGAALAGIPLAEYARMIVLEAIHRTSYLVHSAERQLTDP